MAPFATAPFDPTAAPDCPLCRSDAVVHAQLLVLPRVVSCLSKYVLVSSSQCAGSPHKHDAPDNPANYLRAHSQKNVRMHERTNEQFLRLSREQQADWLSWLLRLPLIVEFRGCRWARGDGSRQSQMGTNVKGG